MISGVVEFCTTVAASRAFTVIAMSVAIRVVSSFFAFSLRVPGSFAAIETCGFDFSRLRFDDPHPAVASLPRRRERRG